MANLGDLDLVEKTRQAAKDLLSDDPELEKHIRLAEKVKSIESIVHFE